MDPKELTSCISYASGRLSAGCELTGPQDFLERLKRTLRVVEGNDAVKKRQCRGWIGRITGRGDSDSKATGVGAIFGNLGANDGRGHSRCCIARPRVPTHAK